MDKRTQPLEIYTLGSINNQGSQNEFAQLVVAPFAYKTPIGQRTNSQLHITCCELCQIPRCPKKKTMDKANVKEIKDEK